MKCHVIELDRMKLKCLQLCGLDRALKHMDCWRTLITFEALSQIIHNVPHIVTLCIRRKLMNMRLGIHGFYRQTSVKVNGEG